MYNTRQHIVFVAIVIIFFSLFFRLFYLQVFYHEKFSEMAQEQHYKVSRIEPVRGVIFDRFMEPLAINLDTPSVFADPRRVTDKERAAMLLSECLKIDHARLLARLKKDKAFVWVKRCVPPSEAEAVKEMGLKGIYFRTESRRHYPNDSLAAHVVGIAGIDNNGLEGVELYYDAKLKGEAGYRYFIRDARLKPILFSEKESMPAVNGYNLILTVDSVIQYIIEKEAERVAEEHNASNVSIIVMDPFTGEILALANHPTFNMNKYNRSPADSLRNPAVSDVYEPGSVFKIVTASAVINEGLVGLDDIIFCENGEYSVGGRILHDFHPYGDLTFTQVISKSSNIGTVKLAKRLGKKRLFDYINRFGFGDKTGIDIPGEVPGISRAPGSWSRSDITTIPIGQGIAVTPIQLACAISVIANGGYLASPFIVKEITTMDGEPVHRTSPDMKRQVIGPDTAMEMKNVLEKVISEGTGRRVRSEKYSMCGKTGTAQMVNPAGGYYDNRYYASFVGFAPEDDPKISIVVVARDPHPVHFGGSVCGPAFKNIAEKVLEYMGSNDWREASAGVTPEDKESE